MSKIAILSDIHSNKYALDKAIELLQDEIKPDEIWCTGDIVGYYTFPNECVEVIKHNCKYVVKGNHDQAISIGMIPENFNYPAAASALWNIKHIIPDHQKYLYSLPSMLKIKKHDINFLLIHGGLEYPLDEYFDNSIANLENYMQLMNLLEVDILLLGHTHIPNKFTHESNMIIVNGSVGQPRDRSRKSCFTILDTITKETTFYTFDYNKSQLRDSIIAEKLPMDLIERQEGGSEI